MKLGLQITEDEYRKLPYPSYSLLSGLSKNGPQVIYGEKIDISDLDSIVIGSIVDSLVTEGAPPSNMVIINKKPSSKALAIIKALLARTDLVDQYLLSTKNKKQIEEECNSLDYYSKSNIDDRIKYLKNYDKYAKALSDHGNDALIVSTYQANEASAIANELFLRFPFLLGNDLIHQIKIVGKVKDIDIKGMLDFILIDHDKKIIKPFDLKTGIGLHNEFFMNGFISWRYFIQSSLYRELLIQHLKDHKTPISDYKVDNFRFMYCSRIDRLPIIYKVTNKWHSAGLNGFTLETKKFAGVYELLEEYKYYIEHPNIPYRKGYADEEIDFDDSLCNILNVNGE